MNKHIPKDGIQRANKHMQRCSMSLTTGNAMRYQYAPIRMAEIKTDHAECGEVWRNENSSIQLAGTQNGSTLENSLLVS